MGSTHTLSAATPPFWYCNPFVFLWRNYILCSSLRATLHACTHWWQPHTQPLLVTLNPCWEHRSIGWHTKLHWHFISILCLAHEVIVLFEVYYMSLENKKLLFKVLWQFIAKRSSVKRELAHSFAPFAHTTLFWPWNYATCDLASSHALWFIVSHGTSTQVFLFHHTDLEISFSTFDHIHAWGHWKSFGWSLHLSASTLVASTFVCLLLHTNFLLHCNYSFPQHC